MRWIRLILWIMEKQPAREYLHLQLPAHTKDLLRKLRYDTRVSITEIVVRLLDQAQKQGVLEDWIKTGGPVPVRPPERHHQEVRPEQP